MSAAARHDGRCLRRHVRNGNMTGHRRGASAQGGFFKLGYEGCVPCHRDVVVGQLYTSQALHGRLQQRERQILAEPEGTEWPARTPVALEMKRALPWMG